jgi:hypothetical protein
MPTYLAQYPAVHFSFGSRSLDEAEALLAGRSRSWRIPAECQEREPSQAAASVSGDIFPGRSGQRRGEPLQNRTRRLRPGKRITSLPGVPERTTFDPARIRAPGATWPPSKMVPPRSLHGASLPLGLDGSAIPRVTKLLMNYNKLQAFPHVQFGPATRHVIAFPTFN